MVEILSVRAWLVPGGPSIFSFGGRAAGRCSILRWTDARPKSTDETMPDDVLESSALHALLAHRFPFLLVDRIRIVEPGRRVIGTKRVSAGEWWCDPQMPHPTAMPFSLVIEALAQTTGALLRDLNDGAAEGLAYFMGADKVRLRRPAYPGDEMALAVTLVQWRRGVCRTRAVATVEGKLVARALLTTIVRSTS